MKYNHKLLGAASVIALVALSASPAMAAGTKAGDPIKNEVSVTFQVGNVLQTAVDASDTFTVDRKVDVTVTEVGGATTAVSPGQTKRVTTFQVTNVSNDTVDLALSVALPAGNPFALSNVEIYLDDGATPGVIDATNTKITFLDELAPDSPVTVLVSADIPLGATAGQVAEVVLTANAFNSGATGLGTTELVNTPGANTAGVDTVLADGAGETDAANQGDFSAKDSYTVSAANVTAAKYSRIITDGVTTNDANAKAIPGATIEYCIAVSNASGTGSATATNVNVVDDLPVEVTYDSVFGIFVNGTVNASNVCSGGAAGGSYDGTARDVSGTLSDIAPGNTRALYFRATIN